VFLLPILTGTVITPDMASPSTSLRSNKMVFIIPFMNTKQKTERSKNKFLLKMNGISEASIAHERDMETFFAKNRFLILNPLIFTLYTNPIKKGMNITIMVSKFKQSPIDMASMYEAREMKIMIFFLSRNISISGLFIESSSKSVTTFSKYTAKVRKKPAKNIKILWGNSNNEKEV